MSVCVYVCVHSKVIGHAKLHLSNYFIYVNINASNCYFLRQLAVQFGNRWNGICLTLLDYPNKIFRETNIF